MMKFRPVEPRISYSHSNLAVLRILFQVYESFLPSVGSHVVRPRKIFCFWQWYFYHCGPGSSVGIATDYGLDGSGSNPGGDEISPGL